MEIPKYLYFRVRVINKGTPDSFSVGVELEDASDVDVAEVVRCKDCKWYDKTMNICGNLHYMMQPDWFCADGERSEDAEHEEER